MDGKDVVAMAVVGGSTAVAIVQIVVNRDSTLVPVVIGFWGTVLGFVFGYKNGGNGSTVQTTEATTQKT